MGQGAYRKKEKCAPVAMGEGGGAKKETGGEEEGGGGG